MTCTTARNHSIRPDYATTMADLYRNAERHADLQERVEYHVDAVACALAACCGFIAALLWIGG